MESLQLARLAAAAAADKKAEDVVLLDLRNASGVADFFVIATGTVSRQIGAIAENVDEVVRRNDKTRRPRREGNEETGWVLMDYGDLIVHLFTPSRRAYYDLEHLWSRAPVLLRMQ